MSIGSYINNAAKLYITEDYEEALLLVCSTIDATARKLFHKKGNKERINLFLNKYFNVITHFGLFGMKVSDLRISYSHPDIVSDAEGCCNIKDILYTMVRNPVTHESSLPANIRFTTQKKLGNEGGILIMPCEIILGLMISVILCPENKHEHCKENPVIVNTSNNTEIKINSMWGKKDIL